MSLGQLWLQAKVRQPAVATVEQSNLLLVILFTYTDVYYTIDTSAGQQQ
jgi:hypothetical protein